jgi:antitoxin HicB
MLYHFKTHKSTPGYWAECIELKGCATQGNTLAELHKNMHAALNVYLDEPDNSTLIPALPSKSIKGKNIVAVPVDIKIAFATLMRVLRLKKGLTQSRAAHLLGMKNIYSYQRLECSKNANPNLSTLARIHKTFPELKVDDLFSAAV